MTKKNKKEDRELTAMTCEESPDLSTSDFAKQKRFADRKIKEAIRKAVTKAFYAGYEAGKSGDKYGDGDIDVVESIISDTWDKIRKTIGDLLDAIGDAIDDINNWVEEGKKKLKDMFDWRPW